MRAAIDHGWTMRWLGDERSTRSGWGLVPLMLLASCVAPEAPSPPPPSPPAPPPRPAPPPVATDWRYAPLTPGVWTWRVEGGRSIASFGIAGAPPLVTFACEGGSVVIVWTRVPAASSVTLTTTYGARTLPATARPSGTAAALGPRDPMLDQIAFSRGRIMLAADGSAAIMPAWAELSRVVEDCRK